MQEIKAYIKVRKLEAVTLALHRLDGITGMSVSDVRGFGRSKAHSSATHPIEGASEFSEHVKVEIVCQDHLVDAVVDLLKAKAHTGLRGDGRIFVADVRRAVRIQDGEEGDSVV